MPRKAPNFELILRSAGLRVTRQRQAIVALFVEGRAPISSSEVHQELASEAGDQATTYRNLVKLREAGILRVVSRADGIDRYEFADSTTGDRYHAHFECENCGQVACLPPSVSRRVPVKGRWARSIRDAAIQLRGTCPDCLAEAPTD